MKKSIRSILVVAVLVMMMFVVAMPAFAAADTAVATGAAEVEEAAAENTTGTKAVAAAAVVGIVAAAGAVGMALAIVKSVDGIARQPEAEGKIRTTMMLGLIFVETAIIYALVIAILIIFVL